MKNKCNTFMTIAASGHSREQREEYDFYASHPKAAEVLVETGELDKDIPIWECACGQGHLSEEFLKNGFEVTSSDLIDRGYGETGIDFFACKDIFEGNIVTNPPYKLALDFCKHALDLVPEGNKVAMFLRVLFLEGKQRKNFFLLNPPKTIYVSSSRISCAKNADFKKYTKSAQAYAWFVWQKGYKGESIIKWIN